MTDPIPRRNVPGVYVADFRPSESELLRVDDNVVAPAETLYLTYHCR